MSDALCGPTNALQNFQKHASVDRTLQQDRLISSQSPSQGFRSQNHSEGILDPEFAAFESNNLVGAPHPDLQHAVHFPAPAPHMPMSHPGEVSNWATDFQNLHIAGPSHPIHQHPGPSVAPVPAAPQQAWHNEFLRQQQQQQQQHQQLRTPAQQHQPFVQGLQSQLASSYAMQNASFTPPQETTTSHAPQVESFDESAFEAAFEQAKADMASQELDGTHVEIQASTIVMASDKTEELVTQNESLETIRIGSDTIPQSNKNDPQSAMNDADELARTAGQLLNSVSHDTSQKFRESNFLALMRRIRDREVHVQGDEFRETAQPLHPGGKYYPGRKRRQEEDEKRSWRPTGQNDYVHVTSNENNNTRLDVAPEGSLSRENIDKTIGTSNETPKNTVDAVPFGDFGPMTDGSLYASWNHGDRWA